MSKNTKKILLRLFIVSLVLAIVVIAIDYAWQSYKRAYVVRALIERAAKQSASSSLDNNIGTYQLGPYTFKMPRSYLWQSQYPDGERKSLYMQIHFPSGDPAPADWKSEIYYDVITLTVDHFPRCPNKPCKENASFEYKHAALRVPENFDSGIDNPVYDEVTGLRRFQVKQKYDLPNTEVDDVYFEGEDAHNPNYWFACGMNDRNPGCQGTFKFVDEIWVDWKFNHKQIQHHREIFKLINEKMKSFMFEKAM
ncbi:MAG: hypothetical protein MRY32_00105 [Rickettsiales bacterium]|nr:hypothetical protein [Rickettsiales bacterium]